MKFELRYQGESIFPEGFPEGEYRIARNGEGIGLWKRETGANGRIFAGLDTSVDKIVMRQKLPSRGHVKINVTSRDIILEDNNSHAGSYLDCVRFD